MTYTLYKGDCIKKLRELLKKESLQKVQALRPVDKATDTKSESSSNKNSSQKSLLYDTQKKIKNQRLVNSTSLCTGRTATDTKPRFLPNKNSLTKKSLLGNPTTQIIQQTCKKSSKTINNQQQKGDVMKSNVTLYINDITKDNKQEKMFKMHKLFKTCLEEKDFTKAGYKLGKLEPINRLEKSLVKSDCPDITINMAELSPLDVDRMEKALRNIGFGLGVATQTLNGEAFVYKSQEQLTNLITQELTEKTRNIYDFVIDYFDLPNKTIMTKAILKHKGKVIYSPQTGQPLTTDDFKKFVTTLEKFLNRNYKGIGQKIVLTSEVLGRLLDRMSKNQSLEALKKIKLEDLSLKSKKIDWISDSIKNIKNTFGDSITRLEASRIQVATLSAAQKITKVSDELKNEIQQIIIDGIKDRKSKSNVSQKLFDTCASLNRNFARIADTEIQNNVNTAYVHEEVYNSNDTEKVYFKRVETIDEFTCAKCKAIDGLIALWSNYPIESETIKDEYASVALWDGKNDWNYKAPITVKHPYCRGVWIRCYPEKETKKELKKASFNPSQGL